MRISSLKKQWFSGLVVYIYNHLNQTTYVNPVSSLTLFLNHLNFKPLE